MFFGLFKRKKRTEIEEWELELLLNVLTTLPEKDDDLLIEQIRNGALSGIDLRYPAEPGYVSFTFHQNALAKYKDEKKKAYKLEEIRVFDLKSQFFLDYTIYVFFGMVHGYFIKATEGYQIDPRQIDVSHCQKAYYENHDFDQLKQVLTSEEIDLMDPSSIYVVVLDGKDYYHIKDLEDGDFIGMDLDRNIYECTHDPYQIIPLKVTLKELLNDVK
ncbi:hypothetical protein [Pedobacter caeni]|uniref:Uncharacterized protein n=1 Tax=Pedobacter caeni TaxID=288992 RepID=A0A1M5JK32_9SPHI|nr:hypothetical protein [Pedobacter caeni]SHG40922.1 hypothetical protein SAMN04488522_105394 [Pedobacter caeni]